MMKIKRNVIKMFFVFFIIFTSLPAFSVEYDKVSWYPTDNDINLFNISLFNNGPSSEYYDLYLYDWGDPSINLLILGSNTGTKTIYFSKENNEWYADNGINKISLGSDPTFGLYFYDGIKNIGYDYNSLQPNKSYYLETLLPSGKTQEILLVDAAPVPLPSSLIIFLIGLGGIVLSSFRKISCLKET